MRDISVLKWIYKSCGKRRAEIAALILLNAWSAVCVTMFALLSKTVIDCAQNGDGDALLKNAVSLLLLIFSQMLARVLSSFIETVSQGKAEISLKTKIFSNVLCGEYSAAAERHSGDIMTRLTADVTVVGDTAVSILPAAVSYVVRIISAAAALLALDRSFALIFIGCGILIVFAAALFRKPLKSFHRRVQEKDSAVRSFMQEMVENLFAVKVFRIEKKIIDRASVLQKDLYREKLRRRSFSIAATMGFSIAFAVGFLAAVSYGSYGILKGTMSFGTVAALIQLVNQLQSPAAGITGIIPTFFAMTASAQRLIETVPEAEIETHGGDGIKYGDFNSIKFDGVTFGYGGETVLKNASFTVKKGEFVGVKGQSGIGKTTVFKLLTGLYRPDSGNITVDTFGGERPPEDIHGLISIVPQGNMLFSGTVRENVMLLRPDADENEVKRALTLACAEFVYELDNGLDTQLNESGSGISEGQAQRLAIARALLGCGKILLMDEATSALDTQTEQKLLGNIKNIRELTVIFITHREAVIDKCDRVITLSDGEASESVKNN
ncbi:MAG: ABC transporter ATP-binding protein [Oscillospiraceae bacterium]|nr:ABC transporter ATP-binding protein [Oscillospiraceae bacterium]